MPALAKLFGQLLGRGRRLSALETLVLRTVGDQLEGSVALLWDAQTRAINKVQRLPEGMEVNFYRIADGRPSADPNLAFPNKTEELLLARVRLGLPNTDQKLAASVWCVKGFLFSIEYSASPAYFEEAAGMDPKPDFDVHAEICADLSKTELAG